MGMFTKDVLFGGERLDKQEWLAIGDSPHNSTPVLLLDCRIVSDEVPTEIGLATKSELLIAPLSENGTKAETPIALNTLAKAIAEKVRAKEEGDLPAVVCFFVTAASKEGYSDATVMQFVRRWDGKTPKFEPLPDVIPF